MTKLFLQLLRRDFLILRQEFWANLINVLFWLIPNVIVSIYILPGLGISASYGVFILMGVISEQGLFTAISNIPGLLSDIEDSHAIYYYLSLPLYPWLLFVRYALSFAMSSFMMSCMLLPVCKILLWSVLDLSNFSLIKYLVFFIVLQIFFGFFALLVTAYTKSITQYERAWVRIVWPMIFFGGYQFPWRAMLDRLPYLAYLNLLNPITYCLEGFRAAVLGQEGYINFWICFGMLLLSTFITAIWGIRKFMQRLDCVR
jgi:ABC-2 type transport system permease protein